MRVTAGRVAVTVKKFSVVGVVAVTGAAGELKTLRHG